MYPSDLGARCSLTRRRRKALSRGGFSLIELLVIIGIMGVVFSYAAWSITGYLPKWRLQGAAGEIVQRFQQARAESVKRNLPVIVKLNNIGSSSSSSVQLLVDNDRDYVGDTLILQRVIPDLYNDAYIIQAADGSSAVTTVAMGPDGTIKSINGAGKGTMPVTITLDSVVSTTPETYQVIVDRSGAARVK